MKVLHIATSDSGGAGIAALRLHLALLKAGTDSKFLCMYARAKGVPQHYVHPVATAHWTYRAFNRLGFPITQNQKYWRKITRLSGSYELATLPFHDLDLSVHPLVKEADIINLHFISYFLDIPSFFRKVQKPIVWTLHDMSPFLGCFHYRMDSENNAAAFGLLEKELIEIKRTAYNEHQTLKIVTPSKWLMRESMASTALRNKEHYHIRYSLDTDLFKPGDTKLIRHQYGLPDNKTLFLFVSEQLGNKRKGFDLLLQAINNLSPDKFHLASIGRPSGELQRLTNYTALGTIEDTKEMAKLYAAADAFVLPSREDNLPNTMLEALSCGTPVVAFRTGGMADEIEPGFNGYLADEMNPNCLSVALQKFLDNPLAFDNAAIRCRAVKLYSMIRQAEEYKRLYASFEI